MRKRTGGTFLEAGTQNSQFLKQIRMPLLTTDSKKLLFPIRQYSIIHNINHCMREKKKDQSEDNISTNKTFVKWCFYFVTVLF